MRDIERELEKMQAQYSAKPESVGNAGAGLLLFNLLYSQDPPRLVPRRRSGRRGAVLSLILVS